MTKEQILDAADEPYFIQKGTEIVVRDAALTAMDEYAKQVAQKFVRWAYDNALYEGFDEWLWPGDSNFQKKVSTEELYNLYLTTKDK